MSQLKFPRKHPDQNSLSLLKPNIADDVSLGVRTGMNTGSE